MTSSPIRLALWSLVLGCLAALAGCGQNEDVGHYQVPHEDPPDKVRLLGALFPEKNTTWVFKLTGPESVLKQYQDAYLRLIESVRLTNKPDQPITWTLPEGWKQEAGGNDLRHTVIRAGGPGPGNGVEVVLSKLDRRQNLLANVNRWRRQIGLADIEEQELPRVSKEVKINGVDVTLVSLTAISPRKIAQKALPPGLPPELPPGHPPQGLPFKYTVPEGWKQAPPVTLSVLAFKVGEGEERPEVTVIPLGGEAGGLLGNVIRWRGQVGLGPITEAELKKDQKKIEVNGTEVPYFDLAGPADKGGKRMLVVVLKHDDTSWFFKLLAPADVVAKQQAAFEAFVKSVRFDAGKGAEQ